MGGASIFQGTKEKILVLSTIFYQVMAVENSDLFFMLSNVQMLIEKEDGIIKEPIRRREVRLVSSPPTRPFPPVTFSRLLNNFHQ